MNNEKQNSSNNAKLTIAMFGLSAICLAAALFGTHGLLTSAPTLGGVGSIVGAAAFFAVGLHLHESSKTRDESRTDRTES